MKFKHTALASAIALTFAAQASAEQVSGKVVDASGKGIAGVEVSVHEGASVTTNEQGQFTLDVANLSEELHLVADGYVHLTQNASDASKGSFVMYRAAIEEIDVIGVPLHISNLRSTVPVTILDEEAVRDAQAANLGETLNGELGIHSSYYGPVSSSPVIRGLDGPRVLIAQNGLDVGDISRGGPDHAVSTESATTERIEVLRGPSTLFFGSGAIGGVVNVIDNRIPTSTETEGSVQYTHREVSADNEFVASVNTGVGQFALHADGFYRDGNDYRVPGNPEAHHDDHDEDHHDDHDEDHHDDHDEEFSGRLENSASRAKGATIGGSYILDNGYVGISVGHSERLYGIPGHSHGDELVKADMQQDRVQLVGEFALDNSIISSVNARAGYTDYEHAELEGDEVGTLFTSEVSEVRTELKLAEMAGWHGSVLVDYKQVEQTSEGEEAYAPGSKTKIGALALVEEKEFGDFLWQLGARIESVKLSTSPFEFEMHHEEDHDEHHGDDHDDDHHDDDHGDEHHDEEHEEYIQFADESFTPFSLSTGVVWDFAQGQNVGVSYTYAQRAPSAAELYSAGPHIGTGSFELGTQFEAHEEDGEVHIDLHEAPIELETSNNIELSYRKFEGDFGLLVNVFYNRVNDYYYAANTGLTIEAGHDHGHEDEHHDDEHHDDHDADHDDEHHDEEHGDELPIYAYQQQDVELIGLETLASYRINDMFKIEGQFDSVAGRLIGGGNLPRIPPMRLGSTLEFNQGNWRAQASAMYYFEQDQVARYEEHTGSYTMVDLLAEYTVPHAGADTRISLKVNNLLNEEARVHTSYLKEMTLLPSRGVELSVRSYF